MQGRCLVASILCSPHAHQVSAAHWDILAPRETKGALCHMVSV